MHAAVFGLANGCQWCSQGRFVATRRARLWPQNSKQSVQRYPSVSRATDQLLVTTRTGTLNRCLDDWFSACAPKGMYRRISHFITAVPQTDFSQCLGGTLLDLPNASPLGHIVLTIASTETAMLGGYWGCRGERAGSVATTTRSEMSCSSAFLSATGICSSALPPQPPRRTLPEHSCPEDSAMFAAHACVCLCVRASVEPSLRGSKCPCSEAPAPL